MVILARRLMKMEHEIPVLPASSELWALAALATSMGLASLGVSIANVALPEIARVFAAPYPAVQWVVIGYLLAMTVGAISAGRLGDMLGHRRVLIGGLVLFAMASLICAAAPSLAALIVARGLQGVGAAVLMALTVAMVRDTVPKERTGRAMGLLGTMSAVGTAVGPVLGGFLIEASGWWAIFLAMAGLAVLALFLVARFLPAPERATAEPVGFDGLGTVLLTGTLVAYALGVTLGGGTMGWRNLTLLITAALGFWLFLMAERHMARPLIRLAELRDPILRTGLAVSLLVATVMMSTLVVGPFYLSQVLGLTVRKVGLMMSVGPLISMLSGVLAGWVVDRLGAAAMVMAGLGAMGLGAVLLAVLPGVWGYALAIAVLTPGYQMVQAANTTSVMLEVPIAERGKVSGLLGLARNLGLITGASLMGAVFMQAVGTGPIATATVGALARGMTVTFLLAAALVGLALLLAVRARR
jgi:MFS family permease